MIWHRHYDVVVVGGGPGGTAFARTLRRLRPECRLLLLDQARFPRDKACGDALTYRSIPALRAIFPELAGRFPTASHTSRQVIWYPNGSSVARDGQVLDVVPRRILDHALWEATRASGVEAWEGARVTRVIREGERVRGVEVERDGACAVLGCDLLVGADGSGSTIRRQTGSLAGDKVIFAVRQYVRGVPPETEGLLFFFDRERVGYFWVFPFRHEGERWANVGYGTETRGGDLRAALREYTEGPDVRRFLGSGQLLDRPRGFPLNLARAGFARRFRPARPMAGDGYRLVGDAAALVHPLSGEGIAFALESGRLAAEVEADRSVAPALKGRAYEERVARFAVPLYSGLGAFLALRAPVILPRPLADAYTRAAGWAHRVLHRHG